MDVASFIHTLLLCVHVRAVDESSNVDGASLIHTLLLCVQMRAVDGSSNVDVTSLIHTTPTVHAREGC